jgi:hypothetical protein
MRIYETLRDFYWKNAPPGIQNSLSSFLTFLSTRYEMKSVLYDFNYKGKYGRERYYYCVYQAAKLAKRLSYDKISVIEFGVAGGNGLLELEKCAAAASKIINIKIEVYGFDTGEGLPVSVSYRDLPFVWNKGLFKMDIEKLKKRLTSAQLVIGDVRETGKTFFEKYTPAPIGAVMFDMDYYSSTIGAFNLFESSQEHYLPRIFTYFDDILGDSDCLLSDYTGERLAINEFNESHGNMKFSPAYHLITAEKVRKWYHQIYILHSFEHKDYNTLIEGKDSSFLLTLR